jgi:acylphosphatase
MMICKRVHYRGMVQGVGFRMTARRLADGFAVGGYVRNLADGRVEMVVAGEAEEIDRFLGAIAARMGEYIHGQDLQDEAVQSFETFEIWM